MPVSRKDAPVVLLLVTGLLTYCAYLSFSGSNDVHAGSTAHARQEQYVDANGPVSGNMRSSMNEPSASAQEDTGLTESFEFEVFGRVQGVSFRKYTQRKAQELGLVGYVFNTVPKGTVKGVAQGPPSKCQELKKWLEKEGSPASTIDKAKFENKRLLSKKEYISFAVLRDSKE
eukprot:gb/GECG01005312.1/.p1 GENE.gb/GECG01005312.1/~~gb/GECG01005312.1/.p1  ORF type:complete len:173 (+),score=21.78 gb/GECG01005312.1/:1-519(+)